MLDDDPIVRFFHKHLVPILFTVQEDSGSRQFIVTAFVLSVKDQWFLITAGHCLRQIEEIQSGGAEIITCALIDTLGENAEYEHTIPFAYKHASPVYLSDELEFDYGIISLSGYYRQLLEANNIQPLSEQVWDKQPDSFDFFKLVGVPFELLDFTTEFVKVTTALFDIETLDEAPKEISKTSFPQFIGKIYLDKSVKDIRGTSGGPIFGFRENPPGESRYWLVALQSRWRRDSQIVIGCPTKPLGEFLRSQIQIS